MELLAYMYERHFSGILYMPRVTHFGFSTISHLYYFILTVLHIELRRADSLAQSKCDIAERIL